MEYIRKILYNETETKRRRSNSIQIESMIQYFSDFEKEIKKHNLTYLLHSSKEYNKIPGYEGFVYSRHSSFNYIPFLVICDIVNPYRFIILYSFQFDKSINLVFGSIIYMKDNIIIETHLLNKILMSFDFTEDTPSIMNTFFLNQTLIVCLNNHFSYSYNFNIILVNYDDVFVSTTLIESSYDFDISNKNDVNLIANRWIYFINSQLNKYIFIDLKSFLNKECSIYFDIASFYTIFEFEEYISKNSKENNIFVNDNYIYRNCLTCGYDLVSCTYLYNNVNFYAGNNVCRNCNIFYNPENNEWLPVEFNKNQKIINDEIMLKYPNFRCIYIHVDDPIPDSKNIVI